MPSIIVIDIRIIRFLIISLNGRINFLLIIKA